MTPSARLGQQLIVPSRFCGPPSSGNGGWTAGALATLIDHDCPEDRCRSFDLIAETAGLPRTID